MNAINQYVIKLYDATFTKRVTETARQAMKDMLERLDHEKLSGISDNSERSYRNTRAIEKGL